MPKQKDWIIEINNNAAKWNHEICAITGKNIVNKSYVIWFCNQHPFNGDYTISLEEEKFIKFLTTQDDKTILSKDQMDQLIKKYPNQPCYISRIDNYLNPGKNKKSRTFCCNAGMIEIRKEEGFSTFKKLLEERGIHYKTKYTLQISSSEYNGKRQKYPIKCEAHHIVVYYSMQDLNTITSCPCPECRVDPKHKNSAVDIVQKRNAGRPGQVIRHASHVKEKYGNKCALSNSTFDLQHHHLDGADFYQETALDWNNNGICLCGTIHRDYHNNFLKNHSIIAKEYTNYTFNDPDLDQTNIDSSNPDFKLDGAEISRYTFLEYLKFLTKDVLTKGSYVKALNQKMSDEYSVLSASQPSCGSLGQIDLNTLTEATKAFVKEYKGDNWKLAKNEIIPFANDASLWKKVEDLFK